MENLREQLIKHEGFESKVYQDNSKNRIWTWGIGRNLEDKGLSKHEQVRIFGSFNPNKDEVIEQAKHVKLSRKIALFMLDNDIKEVISELDGRIEFLDCYPEDVVQVLTNMAFNMGVPRLMKFKKFLKALSEGRWVDASDEMMDSLWANQVGYRAEELRDVILNIGSHETA